MFLKLIFMILLALFQKSGDLTLDSFPKKIASEFYRACINLKISGLPDDDQLRVLAPFLHKDLQRLFKNAKREQARFKKKFPDEKPPWIEGDLFSSLWEGPQSFEIGSVKESNERAEVDVSLEYLEEKSVVQWTDTLVLIKAESRWRVWDIQFKGTWAFKTGNSLRGILQTKNND